MMHTPGPWTASFEPYEDGTPYFRFRAGNLFLPNEEMGFEFCAIMRPDDAALIAAAPDLLVALRDIMDARWRAEGMREDHADAARAAIAKATTS